ncbi:MAG: A/G-specific adenine glycosylase [Actinomycetota bacterium]|nr:MAG: A/G-specific adenine glycosylase [Actinomycetota bacterium]
MTGADRRSAAGPDIAAEPALVDAVCAWYLEHRRDLPWRAAGTTAWGVLVSEVMLQQTPAERVRPAWTRWLQRWPDPPSLAAASRADVIRAWERLGYPRRALRLREAAIAITTQYGGQVPASEPELRSLPGVGEYTAAAVAAFAHGRRAVVLDTNVRRVLARVIGGRALPGPSLTVAERARAAAVLPQDPARAALWSVGAMELGAVVCSARAPACQRCPVSAWCAWAALGRPAYAGPTRVAPGFAGTDREVRGRLLAVLRDRPGPAGTDELASVWPDPEQRARALAGLVADGLVTMSDAGHVSLPA